MEKCFLDHHKLGCWLGNRVGNWLGNRSSNRLGIWSSNHGCSQWTNRWNCNNLAFEAENETMTTLHLLPSTGRQTAATLKQNPLAMFDRHRLFLLRLEHFHRAVRTAKFILHQRGQDESPWRCWPHLHRTAFPGAARQGRCGAVQVEQVCSTETKPLRLAQFSSSNSIIEIIERGSYAHPPHLHPWTTLPRDQPRARTLSHRPRNRKRFDR